MTNISMETENYNNYEQEASRKRPSEDLNNERQTKRVNTGETLPLLKLLIPNYVAGALIGKGGAVMTELQNRFGGNIRLSANREFYPGTVERIVVLTGEVDQIAQFNDHIIETFQVGEREKGPKDDGRAEQVKIVLTNGAAGLLIGRAGSTIKGIQDETKAKITITNRDNSMVHGERVLTMSGSMEQRMEACRKVIETIATEPSNVRNNNLKYMGGSITMTPIGGNNIYSPPYDPTSAQGGMNSFALLNHSNVNNRYKTTVQIQMEVPDIMVGAILGKQGQTVSEFIHFSGARIKFSDKNEYAPGTTDRILTITGDMKQAETAYFLVTQKVDQIHNELENQY